MSQSNSTADNNVRLAWQWIMDGGIAAGLVVMLGVVFVVDLATRDSHSADATKPETITSVETVKASAGKRWRLAVTGPQADIQQYDDVSKVLDQLGEGYSYSEIRLDDLRDEKKLGQFDVVFITCGTLPNSWAGAPIGSGARDTRTVYFRPQVAEEVRNSLRQYVTNGGTLYASDWRYALIATSFPEFVNSNRLLGGVQEIDAKVVDEAFHRGIGETIHLRFDMPDWNPAAFEGREVKQILSGTYRSSSGEQATAPLLVKFPVGKGNVIFTSFHNEKNISAAQLELLKLLVFSSVTAQSEALVSKQMTSGGFSPQKQNLLSASTDAASVTESYECSKPGPLHFALAFENQGALLHLEVVGPDGKKFEKEGLETLQIDVPDPSSGNWKYTVTAKKVPFANFPFHLSVWQ